MQTTEQIEGYGIKDRVNLRSIFPSGKLFIQNKSWVLELLEVSIDETTRKLKMDRKTLSLLKLESLFKYANDWKFLLKTETVK